MIAIYYRRPAEVDAFRSTGCAPNHLFVYPLFEFPSYVGVMVFRAILSEMKSMWLQPAAPISGLAAVIVV